MTSNQNLTVDEALALHGFASIDDAREANVFHVCHACGSIKTCTPGEGRTREQERDILIATYEGMDECCDDGDDSIL